MAATRRSLGGMTVVCTHTDSLELLEVTSHRSSLVRRCGLVYGAALAEMQLTRRWLLIGGSNHGEPRGSSDSPAPRGGLGVRAVRRGGRGATGRRGERQVGRRCSSAAHGDRNPSLHVRRQRRASRSQSAARRLFLPRHLPHDRLPAARRRGRLVDATRPCGRRLRLPKRVRQVSTRFAERPISSSRPAARRD